MALLAKAQYSSSLQQIRLYRDSLHRCKIGSPRPGAIAPNLDLRSTAGRSFNLASQRGGQRVLLVFERFLNRNQIRALHKDAGRLRSVGIGSIVVVVAHHIDEAARVNGSTVSTSVLVDPGGTRSSRYSTGERARRSCSSARTAGSSDGRTTRKATLRRARSRSTSCSTSSQAAAKPPGAVNAGP